MPTITRRLDAFLRNAGLPRAFLVAVVALFLVKLIVGFSLPARQAYDFAAYREHGHQFATGKAYYTEHLQSYAWRPPGYPFLLGLAYRVSGGQEAGATALDAVCGTLLAVACGAIVLGLSGPGAGLFTLVFLGLLPLNLMYGWVSASETPFGAFLFGGLAILLHALRNTGRATTVTVLVAGLLMGYACLIRPTGLVAVLICGAYLFASSCARRSCRVHSVQVAVFAIGVALAIAPWTMRNYHYYHRFVLISTNGGEVFYAANVVAKPELGGAYILANYKQLRQAVPDEVKRNTLGFIWGLRYIASHPRILLYSLPHRYRKMLEQHDWVVPYALDRSEAQYGSAVTAFGVAAANFSYWLLPALLMLNLGGIWRLLCKSVETRLLTALYLAYLVVLPFFEVFQRTYYPYLLLPAIVGLMAIASARSGMITTDVDGENEMRCSRTG
jgi:4-amino-4-deoxy-L-arabinose transferase-like glycosyltransferase